MPESCLRPCNEDTSRLQTHTLIFAIAALHFFVHTFLYLSFQYSRSGRLVVSRGFQNVRRIDPVICATPTSALHATFLRHPARSYGNHTGSSAHDMRAGSNIILVDRNITVARAVDLAAVRHLLR